jgi:T5orf172 domain-containing protein
MKGESFFEFLTTQGSSSGTDSLSRMLAEAIDSGKAFPLSLANVSLILEKPYSALRSATTDLVSGTDYLQGGALYFSIEGVGKLAAKYLNFEVQKHIMETSVKHSKFLQVRLAQEKALLQTEKKKTETLIGKLSTKYVPGERIYVMHNTVYDVQNMFKIGRTKDLAKRLVTYNTSNINGVSIVYDRVCCDSKLVESLVHHVLAEKRCARNREYFECSLRLIKRVVDHAVESTDGARSSFTLEEGESSSLIEKSVPEIRELQTPGTCPPVSSSDLGPILITSPYFERFRYNESASLRPSTGGAQRAGPRM